MVIKKVVNLTGFLDGQNVPLAQRLAAAGNTQLASRIQRIEEKPFRIRSAQENAFLQSAEKTLGSPQPGSTIASYPNQRSHVTELYPSKIVPPGGNEAVYRPEMPWGTGASFQDEGSALGQRLIADNPAALSSERYNMPYELAMGSVTGARSGVDFTLGGSAGRAAADYLGGAPGVPGLIDKMGGPQTLAGGYAPDIGINDTLTDVYSAIASGRQHMVLPKDDPMAWVNPGTAQDVPNALLYKGQGPDDEFPITGAGGSEVVSSSEIPRLMGLDDGIHTAATNPPVRRLYQDAIDTRDRSNAFQPGKNSPELDARSTPSPTSYNPVLNLSGNAYDAAFTTPAETTGFLAARGQRAQADALANIHLQRSARDFSVAANDQAARGRIANSFMPLADENLSTTYVMPEARASEYGFAAGSSQPAYNLTATDAARRPVPGVGSSDGAGNVENLVREPGRYGLPQNSYVGVRSDIYSPFTSTEPRRAWMSIDAPPPDQAGRRVSPLSSENPGYYADDPTFPGDALYDAPALIRKKLALEEGGVTRALDQYDAMGGDVVYNRLYSQSLDRQSKGLPTSDLDNQMSRLFAAKAAARGGQEKVSSLMNSQEALQGNIQRAFDEMGYMPDFVTAKTRTGNQVVTEDLPIEEVVRRNQQNPVRQILSLPQGKPTATHINVNGEQVPLSQMKGYRLYGSPDSSSVVTKHMDEDAQVLAAGPDSPMWNSTDPVYRAIYQADPTARHNQVRQGVQYIADAKGKVQLISPGTVVASGNGSMTAQPYDFISAGSQGTAPNRYREARAISADQKAAMDRTVIEQAKAEGWNVNTSPDYAAIEIKADGLGRLNADRTARGLAPLNLTEVNALGGMDTARGQFNRQTYILDAANEGRAQRGLNPNISLQDVRRRMAEATAQERRGGPVAPQQVEQLRALASQVLQQPTVYRQAPVSRAEIVGGFQGGGQNLIANLNATPSTMAGVPTANVPVPRVYTPASGSALTPEQARLARDSELQIARNQGIDDEVLRARQQVGSMIVQPGGQQASTVVRSQAQPSNPYPEAAGDRPYSVTPLPAGVNRLPDGGMERSNALHQGDVERRRQLLGNRQLRSEHVSRLQSEIGGLRNTFAQARAAGDGQSMQRIVERGNQIQSELDYFST